jgi:peptide/nickel transport system permease protein
VTLRRSGLGLLGAVLAAATVAAALLAPIVAPAPPTTVSLGARLLPPMARDRAGVLHPLGTDQLGRDVLSRIVYGARISLVVGVVTVALAGVLGLGAGLVSGYAGSAVDSVIMRIVDLQLAFPFILLALAIVALLGPSLTNIILVFVVTSWPVYARTARASVLVVRSLEFVEAARSAGAPASRLLLRHVLPNALGPMLVIASFEMARVIIVEAAISFLGLGIRPPTPTWGNMLADGRAYIRDAWWLSTFPGLAIMLLAASVNFIGDAVRDALDPRLR